MGTPNYVLTERVQVDSNKVLEAGSFARPIGYDYLPAHLKEKYPPSLFKGQGILWVYTYYGIVCVMENQVRQV